MTKKEELEKDYDYWIGLTFSDGSNVSPKDRAYFLTKLKKEYLSTLRENQKIDVLSNTVEKLTKELSEERSLNSDLTEENERLTVSYETLKLHDEEEIRMKDFRIKELEAQVEKMLHTFLDLLWFEEHLDPYMYECTDVPKRELLKPFDNARLFLENYKCKKCKGEGTIKVGYDGWTTNPCPACKGKGYIFRR